MNYKKCSVKFIDYLSVKEINQLSHYLHMLELSNILAPLSIIGYILATASIVIKYIISNDAVLSIRSFIIPQTFAFILILISTKLGDYSLDKIEIIVTTSIRRYLKEMTNKNIKIDS